MKNMFSMQKKHSHCLAIEQDIFESLCFDKNSNIGYKLLCLLHKYRVLKSVWTTNFDRLVERVAHRANITPININLRQSRTYSSH